MEIEVSEVKKIQITKVENLDPITVFAEDVGYSRGKVTIECYGSSWSAFWGGTGCHSIMEFFSQCNNDYLMGKLAPGMYSTVNAEGEDLKEALLKAIEESDSMDSGEKDVAREDIEFEEYEDNPDLMRLIYGEDPYLFFPQVPNPRYIYICRIIDAVRAAFGELLDGEKEDKNDS